jgi:hypothetical protein
MVELSLKNISVLYINIIEILYSYLYELISIEFDNMVYKSLW